MPEVPRSGRARDERRSAIRHGAQGRIHYCPASDLLPRDGWITNLSERGAGLLLHTPHRCGERLTVNFTLPGARARVTVTGVVRWTDETRSRDRWCAVGLGWLPLEPAMHRGLTQALASHAARAPVWPIPSPHPLLLPSKTGGAMWIAVGLLIGFAALQQARSISRKNRRLAGILHERRLAIRQLEQQALLLQEELLASKTHLASTASDVTRVSAAAQFLEGAAQQMSQQVERLEEAVAGADTSGGIAR